MNKIWIIAHREFLERVKSRGFILSTIATPLMLIVIWLITGVVAVGSFGPGGSNGDGGLFSASSTTLAYVDEAGLIQQVPETFNATVVTYADQPSAAAALAAEEIEAYYLIPVDYRTTGEVMRYSNQLSVTPPDRGLMNRLLTANILSAANAEGAASGLPVDGGVEGEVDGEWLRQLQNPLSSSRLTFVDITTDGDSLANQDGQAASAPDGTSDRAERTANGSGDDFSLLPFVVVMAIMLPLFAGGGYLLQSLTQEKSSRVMEILLLAVTPRQLLIGKLLGLGALTLVQYLAWGVLGGVVMLPILFFVGGGYDQLQQGVQFDVAELLLVLPYALGGYLTYAALMAGIGALSSDLENSRGWVFVISLPIMVPIYLWSLIVTDPNSTLSVTLSLIPFSTPVAMLMRMTSTTVPWWQIGLSLLLLFGTAAGTVWLMARLFRAQTLLSGEAFSPRRAWAALRSN